MVVEANQSQLELRKRGPLVSIRIGRDTRSLSIVSALVDTGASSSFISRQLARELRLLRVSIHGRFVHDMEGKHEVEDYEAELMIGDLGIPSPRVLWGFHRFDSFLQVILGRDILANLNMVYEGPVGRVRLDRPKV